MVADNTERMKTAYTITVDYARGRYQDRASIKTGSFLLISKPIGTTTGISAHDRCATVKALADFNITDCAAFSRPGHVFPLRYTPGGVLVRPGHTEAAVG